MKWDPQPLHEDNDFYDENVSIEKIILKNKADNNLLRQEIVVKQPVDGLYL